MRKDNLERMADGLIRLRTELQRRKEPGEVSAHDLTTSQAQALRLIIFEGPQRIGSLAHAGQAPVAPPGAARHFMRVEARPVVADGELDLLVVAPDAHQHLGAAGILMRVL